VLASVEVDDDDDDDEDLSTGPSVHTHSLLRFRRPATGVSGAESLSESVSEDESRFSPVRGPPKRLSSDATEAGELGMLGSSEEEDVESE